MVPGLGGNSGNVVGGRIGLGRGGKEIHISISDGAFSRSYNGVGVGSPP